MPTQPTCRLCLEYCTEGYCDLYNEDFQVDCETTAATAANEVFDMVRKYFPEDVLNMDCNKDLRKLCLQCWHHIEEFHKFQESIILLQNMRTSGQVIEMVDVIESYEPEIPIKFEEFNICEQKNNNDNNTEQPQEDEDEVQNIMEENINDFVVDTRLDPTTATDEENETDNFITEIIESEYHPGANTENLNNEDLDELISKWKSNLECVVCGENHDRYSLLRKHFEQQHPLDEFHIVCCGLALQKNFEIEGHILYHKALSDFRCEICMKRFANRSSTKRHFKNKHATNLAGKLVTNLASRRPIKMEKEKFKLYKCKTCDKLFLDNMAIKVHNEAEHGAEQREICCKFCHGTFAEYGEYQMHLNREHQEEWQAQRNQEAIEMLPEIRRHMAAGVKSKFSKIQKKARPINDSSANCKCWICGNVYHSRRYLLAHIGLHDENKEARYSCQYCSKKYHLQTSLSYHIRLKHEQRGVVKPLKCKICHKVYYTKKAMREHQSKHEGRPLFSCKICSKEYFLSSSLSSHMKSCHSGGVRTRRRASVYEEARLNSSGVVASYKCHSCDKIYQSRRSLREHESKHSGHKAYSCNFCSQQFYMQSSLYTHMKKQHYSLYQRKLKSKLLRRPKEKVTTPKNQSLDDLVKSLDIVAQVENTKPHQPREACSTLKAFGLKCPTCNKIYQSKRSLREHEAKHSGKELYSCQFCGKKFFLKSTKSSHIKRHHPQGCRTGMVGESAICKSQEQNFAIYSIKEVGEGGEEEEVGKAENPGALEETIMSTTETTRLKDNEADSFVTDPLTRGPKNLLSLLTTNETLANKRKPSTRSRRNVISPLDDRQNYAFKCLKCDRRYQSKRSLLAHQQVMHEGKKSYSCKFCFKKFGLETSMYNHLRIQHAQERLAEKINNAQNLLAGGETDQTSLICNILDDYAS